MGEWFLECKKCGTRFPPTHTHQCGEPHAPPTPKPDPRDSRIQEPGAKCGVTHHQGCACHEASWQAKVQELEAKLAKAQDDFAWQTRNADNCREDASRMGDRALKAEKERDSMERR